MRTAPSKEDGSERIAAAIHTTIMVVSAIGVLGFVAVVLLFGDRPAGEEKPAVREIASVFPVGPGHQPVARDMDQVTGVLEALEAIPGVATLRVEFLAGGIVTTDSKRDDALLPLLEPAALVFGPSTSTDAGRIHSVPHGRDVLLTSVTGVGVRGVLAESDQLARLHTVTGTNQDIATVIFDEIGRLTKTGGWKLVISFDGTDDLYANDLFNRIWTFQSRLPHGFKKTDVVSSDGSFTAVKEGPGDQVIRVLLGNEDWWLEGARGRINDARFIILSDGLYSQRIVDIVREAAPLATVLVVTPDVEHVRKHGAEIGCHGHGHDDRGPAFAWHVIARVAVCDVLMAWRQKREIEITQARFVVKEPER